VTKLLNDKSTLWFIFTASHKTDVENVGTGMPLKTVAFKEWKCNLNVSSYKVCCASEVLTN